MLKPHLICISTCQSWQTCIFYCQENSSLFVFHADIPDYQNVTSKVWLFELKVFKSNRACFHVGINISSSFHFNQYICIRVFFIFFFDAKKSIIILSIFCCRCIQVPIYSQKLFLTYMHLLNLVGDHNINTVKSRPENF